MRWIATVLGALGLWVGPADASVGLRFDQQVYDFGPVNIGATSAVVRITATNIGTDAPMFVEPLTFGPDFELVATGGSMSPGATFFWDVVAKPTSRDCSRQLILTGYDPTIDNNFNVQTSIGCTARRTPFDAPDTLNFGTVPPGTPTTRVVSVQNTSPQSIVIDGLRTANATFTGKLRTGTLPITIAPEARFDVELTFSSTLSHTLHETDLRATSGANSYVLVMSALATTSAAPVSQLRLEVSTQFGEVAIGQTHRHPADLVNYSGAAVTVTSVTRPTGYGVEGFDAGTVIPPYARRPVWITFAPPAAGLYDGNLVLDFDTQPRVTTVFRGEGVAPGGPELVSVDAAPDDGVLDFGTVRVGGGPITKLARIHNLDPAYAIACVLDGDGFATTTVCPSNVTTSTTFDLEVTFTPDDRPRRHAGTLIVSDDELALVATVLHPVSTAPDVDLGAGAPGTVRGSIVIRNDGTEPYPITSVTSSDPRFGITGQGRIISPGGEAVLDVELQASAAGTFATTVEIGLSHQAPELVVHVTARIDDGGSGGGCATGHGTGVGVALGLGLLLRRRRRA